MPDPEGPMIATISPRGIATLTSSRAVTRRLPANCLVTCSSAIMCAAATLMPNYVNTFTKQSN